MRHRKSGVKLNRTTSHRQAMFRNMVTSLLKHDRIKTTEAKAKEVRRWADHIITLAKRGDLHARRMALSIVREKDVVHKIFDEASERFGSRNGGYTRIIKIGHRAGDAASISLIELISSEKTKKKTKKKEKPAVEKAEQPAAPATPTPDTTDSTETSAEPAQVAEAEVEDVQPEEVAEDDEQEPVEAAAETESATTQESEIPDTTESADEDTKKE